MLSSTDVGVLELLPDGGVRKGRLRLLLSGVRPREAAVGVLYKRSKTDPVLAVGSRVSEREAVAFVGLVVEAAVGVVTAMILMVSLVWEGESGRAGTVFILRGDHKRDECQHRRCSRGAMVRRGCEGCVLTFDSHHRRSSWRALPFSKI